MTITTTIKKGCSLTPIVGNDTGLVYTFDKIHDTSNNIWVLVDNEKCNYYYILGRSSQFKETYYFNKKLKKGDTLTLFSGTEVSLEDYKIDDLGVTLHLKKPSGEFIDLVYEINSTRVSIIELQYIKNILDILDKESFGKVLEYFEVYIKGKKAKYPEFNIDPQHNTNIFPTKEEAVSYANTFLGFFGNIVSTNNDTETFVSNNGIDILIKKIITRPFDLKKEYEKVVEIEVLFNILYDTMNITGDYKAIYNDISFGKTSNILSKHPDFVFSVSSTDQSVENFLEDLMEYSEIKRTEFRELCKTNNITVTKILKLV